jgi:hypothetical protein
LGPAVKCAPEKSKWTLFHLLVLQSKIGRNDLRTTAHPCLVIGGGTFDVEFFALYDKDPIPALKCRCNLEPLSCLLQRASYCFQWNPVTPGAVRNWDKPGGASVALRALDFH